MNINCLQKLQRGFFQSKSIVLYNAFAKRSKICSSAREENKKSKERKVSCFDQVKALQEKDTHPVSHVIIDMDGVVLDSNYYNILAHEEYLMKWKKPLKASTKYRIMGLRNQDAGRILTEEFDMPFNSSVYAHGVWQIQRRLYPQTKIVRGMQELICYFTNLKMPLAFISSGDTKAFNLLKKQLKGLDKNVCHFVHGDKVSKGKPDPEILYKAAKMFYSGPGDMSKYLLIDGSYNGALAAQAVGMQVIMVSDAYMPKNFQEAANVFLHDIRDFNPTEFHMPDMKKVLQR